MSKIIIEGTVTPSTLLSTGERKTVEHSAFIEKLVAKGYVRVVEDVVESQPVESHAADVEQAAVVVPARNAKREVWAEFLADRRIPFTDDDGRDDLIAIYENSPYFVLDDDRG